MIISNLASRAGGLPLLAAATFVTLAIACTEDGHAPVARPSTETNATPTLGGAVPEDLVVTVYRSPTCGCCGGYEAYLEDEGFQVGGVVMDDVDTVKDDMQIPEEMRSCHTSLVGDYFVEGHVPVEAVLALLRQQPPIDGIALPGMPAGSPGMEARRWDRLSFTQSQTARPRSS